MARPREEAVLEPVVRMVEAGVVPRDLLLSGSYPFDRIADAFAAIDKGTVVKALVKFGPS